MTASLRQYLKNGGVKNRVNANAIVLTFKTPIDFAFSPCLNKKMQWLRAKRDSA